VEKFTNDDGGMNSSPNSTHFFHIIQRFSIYFENCVMSITSCCCRPTPVIVQCLYRQARCVAVWLICTVWSSSHWISASSDSLSSYTNLCPRPHPFLKAYHHYSSSHSSRKGGISETTSNLGKSGHKNVWRYRFSGL